MAQNPKQITLTGRLSFPALTMAEAEVLNSKSDYPDAPDKISPSFSFLLEQDQVDKFRAHVKDEFLPWTQSPEAKTQFSAKDIARIVEVLDDLDREQPPYIPLKPLSEKNAEMAPECAAGIRVKGQRGRNIVVKAVVREDSDLLVPGDNAQFPRIEPIGMTDKDVYPGAVCRATLNLYNYLSGKTPGFSASASTLVFWADADRFGGSVDIDEDEIFLD